MIGREIWHQKTFDTSIEHLDTAVPYDPTTAQGASHLVVSLQCDAESLQILILGFIAQGHDSRVDDFSAVTSWSG